MDNSNKIKHLELIQGVINRLSGNSFSLKGWSVALVSALFALSATDSRSEFVILAYLPAIIFWGLDGFFLWQEQLYRNLYDYVRRQENKDIDFGMDASPYIGKRKKKKTWIKAVFSKTLFPFYGILIFTVTIIASLVTSKGS